MADYEIPVVSDGDHVVDMFNGVKLLTQLNSGATSGQFNSIMATVGLFGLLVVMMNIILRGNYQALGQWILAYALVWGVLFLPKVNVIVVDKTDPTVQTNPVANVPLGIAMVAWVTTQAGDRVATTLETVMAPVDSVKYTNGNMLWGQQVISQMPMMKFTDSVISDNVNTYMRSCVFPVVANDPTRMQAYKSTKDLWGAIKADAPSNRLVYYRQADGTASHVTCVSASNSLDAAITGNEADALKFYGERLYPDKSGTAAGNTLKTDLGAMHATFIGVSRDGGEMLRQTMMINQFKKGLQGYANDTASASLLNYVESRAETQSRLTMSGLGSIMQTAMPRLYTLLFVLLIAIFPFIVAMGLIPGLGFTVVKNYFYSFVFIQAFPVLFIIINRIIVVENAELATAAARGTEAGITLDNMSILAQLPSQTSAMAAVMLTLIPVLAGIFTKGVSMLGGQMESILRPMHVATESAAQEASTGNINVGTSNVDTASFNTLQGNTQKTSASVDSGRVEGYLPNGAMLKRSADGTYHMDSRPAQSNMAVTPEFRSGARAEVRDQLSAASEKRESAQETLSSSQQQLRGQTFAMAMAQGNGVDTNSHFGYSKNQGVSDSLSKGYQEAKDFVESNDVSWTDFQRAYANAEVFGQAGTPGLMKSLFGAGAGIRGAVGGEASLQAQHAAEFASSGKFEEFLSSNKSLEFAEQALSGSEQSRRFSQNNEFTQGYNNSLSDVETAEQSYTEQSSKVAALENVRSLVNSQDSGVSASLGQAQFNAMQERYGLDKATEYGSATSLDPLSLKAQAQAGRDVVSDYVDRVMGDRVVTPDEMTASALTGVAPERPSRGPVSEGFGNAAANWRAQARRRVEEDVPVDVQNTQAGARHARHGIYNASIDAGMDSRGNDRGLYTRVNGQMDGALETPAEVMVGKHDDLNKKPLAQAGANYFNPSEGDKSEPTEPYFSAPTYGMSSGFSMVQKPRINEDNSSELETANVGGGATSYPDPPMGFNRNIR